MYAAAFIVSALAVQYLPRTWLPGWLVWALFLEMAFVAGAFLLELRRDRVPAEAAREAALQAREADPLTYSHQPSPTHGQGRPPVT